MQCSHCGDDAPSGARFCPACGFALPEIEARGCVSCGAPALGLARFCWSCGRVLSDTGSTPSLFAASESPSPPVELARTLQRFLPAQYLDRLRTSGGLMAGERRVVTILFADVKGSTALADQLDPEDVLEIMNGAFRVLIEPIAAQEGTIARLMGDGVLAFFGAPVAHEDDPERACRAALAILNGSRSYAERLQQERGILGFDVRVGLNTGLVVLAEVGDGDRVEYTAMGDAVNLASRMESSAEPGTIMMTEATRRHLGPRFVTASVGALPVRGKAEPVLVHRLLAERSGGLRSRRTHRAPLVGRAAELARIRDHLDRRKKQQGLVLVLTGEAGVGKSRLAGEVRRLGGRSWRWVEVGQADVRGSTAEDAGRSILLGLMGQTGGEKPGAALREQINRLDPSAAPHLLPYLSLLLGCAEGDGVDQLRHLEPAILRARTAQALRHYLHVRAAEGPIALLWDDFHSVDELSVTLMESLIPMAAEAPVIFVLVCREEEGPARRLVDELRQKMKSRVRVLHIGPLKRRGSTQLLGALLGRKRIPSPLQREILQKTQGNPLFLEEVARQMLDEIPAAGTGGDARHLAFTVPDTLRGVVMSRFDALAVPEREVLQAASILEGPFGATLIGHILGGQRSSFAVEASLEELRRKGFLAATGGSAAVYEFSHHLSRQLVAENMLHAQRRLLHRKAAAALETVFADGLEERAGALATHYAQAGIPERAVDYLLRQIGRAVALSPASVVAELCTRGLSLAAEGDVAPALVRELHERLADAFATLARYPEAIEEYDRAHFADAPPLEQAILARKRATVMERIGRYEEALADLERGLDHLRSGMDLAEAVHIYLGLGRVYCRRGECGTAIDMSLIALEMAEQEGDDWGVALACNTLGVIHMKAGDLPAALSSLRRAEATLRARSERYDLSATLTNLGWTYHRLGEPDQAREHLLQSIELCELTGNRHGLATAADLLSQVLIAGGERREADRYLRKAVRIFSGSSGPALVPELWGQIGAW